MSKISVFFFRILLLVGGLVLMYIVGKPMTETIRYHFTGEQVEGRVIGFRGHGTSKTIFEDNTGKAGKKIRARRPVYRYPTSSGSLDSLEAFSSSTILFPWLNFELHEKVQVVFSKNQADSSHIFSIGILLTEIILLLFCVYMIKLGVVISK